MHFPVRTALTVFGFICLEVLFLDLNCAGEGLRTLKLMKESRGCLGKGETGRVCHKVGGISQDLLDPGELGLCGGCEHSRNIAVARSQGHSTELLKSLL